MHQIKIHVEFSEGDDVDRGHDDRKKTLTAAKILDIFRIISDVDCFALGLDPEHARPSWFITTVLPVPPPAVRPSVMFEGKSTNDDLSFQIGQIVKMNRDLRQHEMQGAAAHVLAEKVEAVQYFCATLIDNEIPSVQQSQQRSGKPIKSIRQRLVGKAGRIRGNLMGKRVDFSARTVISGDPNLGIDFVGVPRSICQNLTFPETVTKMNIDKLTKLVENGDEYPGAKTIIRDDGRVIDLRYVKKESDKNLEPGYKVERHIVDGDPILFNRQPSLHKMSIMAHMVKCMPHSSFRLNLCCTSPYNADFDGDEMNLHVPQTVSAFLFGCHVLIWLSLSMHFLVHDKS